MLLFWSYCSFCRYLSSICARPSKAQSITHMPFILLEIAKSTIGAAGTLGQDLSDAPENWPEASPEISDRLWPVQCSMVTTGIDACGNNRVDEFHSDRECLQLGGTLTFSSRAAACDEVDCMTVVLDLRNNDRERRCSRPVSAAHAGDDYRDRRQ